MISRHLDDIILYAIGLSLAAVFVAGAAFIVDQIVRAM